MKVYAPGKLILSGEHAVVHGAPALAMAVNRYATATITREVTNAQVAFDLSDLAHHSRLTFPALRELKERIKRKYHRFIRGEYTIRQVLHKPFELAHVALGILAEALNLSLPHGVKIQVQSDIPMGCGMGSSAATILSVMNALSNYLQVSISDETLFRLALEAENMQHGNSSGLDLRVAMQGGCVYMQDQTLASRALPTVPMYLINTGTPETSTGECVEKVAPLFQSQALIDEFKWVTNAMDQALIAQSKQHFQTAVRDNHQLLHQLGIVPDTVQQFVQAIEKLNGAAKVCGAGAVAGDKAGAVLALTEDEASLTDLCDRYGYAIMPIAGDARGVHVG